MPSRNGGNETVDGGAGAAIDCRGFFSHEIIFCQNHVSENCPVHDSLYGSGWPADFLLRQLRRYQRHREFNDYWDITGDPHNLDWSKTTLTSPRTALPSIPTMNT